MTADEQQHTIDLGDPKAFTALWHKTQPHLLAMAHQLLGYSPQAEDIASDSYVKLWRGLQDQVADRKLVFASELAAIQWLRVTTRNGCLKLLQQQQGQGKKLAVLNETLRDAVEEEWTEGDLQTYQLQLLYAEVRQLPPRARQVFEMRYMQGMGNDAIAQDLGLTYQTVSDHLARAMKMLRLAFKDRPDLLLLLLALCSHEGLLVS